MVYFSIFGSSGKAKPHYEAEAGKWTDPPTPSYSHLLAVLVRSPGHLAPGGRRFMLPICLSFTHKPGFI